MKDALFLLGLGTLITHELDAMLNHEWRVLPILRSLPEDLAINVFVALHIPLIAVIVGLVASSKKRTRDITKITVSVFLFLHGIAHWLSSSDPNYEFSSALSSWLIFGGAVFGAAFLLQNYRESRSANVS